MEKSTIKGRKHCEKKRKCLSQAISHNVFYSYISLVCQNVVLCGNWLTLSQTSPCFYMSAVQGLLKTLQEKEKLSVTSNFSFSRSVFYPFGKLSTIFYKI